VAMTINIIALSKCFQILSVTQVWTAILIYFQLLLKH
jgi:hypothetical protein